jgi:hypothetical protein
VSDLNPERQWSRALRIYSGYLLAKTVENFEAPHRAGEDGLRKTLSGTGRPTFAGHRAANAYSRP